MSETYDTLRPPQLPGSAPDGPISLEGTDFRAVESDEFGFRSAADSNVVVKVRSGGPPRIEIGVYYV